MKHICAFREMQGWRVMGYLCPSEMYHKHAGEVIAAALLSAHNFVIFAASFDSLSPPLLVLVQPGQQAVHIIHTQYFVLLG